MGFFGQNKSFPVLRQIGRLTSVPTPDAPTNLSILAENVGEILLQWDWVPSEPDLLYKLYRNTVDDFNTAVLRESGFPWSNFADDTGTPGATYFYWMVAYFPGGSDSAPSNVVSGTMAT